MKEDFQHIIDKHNAILYKIGRSYTKEAADFQDLYQEMLIQLWQAFPRFKGNSKVSTWMYKVALNTALTYSKKKNKRLDKSPLENAMYKIADNTGDRIAEIAQQSERIELLYACINELKKEERAIILLHLEGNTYEEMAEITGLTNSNLGVKLMRIKKKLHKLLEAKGYARI